MRFLLLTHASRESCARAPQSDAVAEILRSFPDGAFVVPAESVGLSVIRALLEVAKPGRAALRSSGCHAAPHG